MSNSAALARKRRANMPQTAAPIPTPTNQATASGNRVPLSIPQLFQLVEKRIISLEERFKETNTDNGNNNITEDILKDITTRINDNEQKIIEEYESRFEILATQLNDLKEVVLKLQMYTMDVNKVLLENQTVLTTNDVLETIQEEIDSSVEVNDNES
jgi:hypothetical protein